MVEGVVMEGGRGRKVGFRGGGEVGFREGEAD